MTNIYDLTFTQLLDFIENNNLPKFKVKQIWGWLYEKKVTNFIEMKNIDKKTISILDSNFYIDSLEVVTHKKDHDGTQKALLKLKDGELIETVLMKQSHGNSVCVTTQVGCKMGCSFCASQIAGFKRNLTTGEIVQQIMYWFEILKDIDQKVTHVVIMGIGEPFDNYDNVISFLDIINDQLGLCIGARHITISTSGVVPGIIKFAKYDKQVNLAISLHAPNNTLRTKLMKVNNVYPIEEVIDAVKFYIRKTNRRVTFEYIMIDNVNDTLECAKELVSLIRGINCHVNLIPFNPVEELPFSKSKKNTIIDFEQLLIREKIQVTSRTPKGENIDGACGQLRHKNV